MNYYILLFSLLLILIYLNCDVLFENFENLDTSICLDPETKQVRETTKEEKKEIQNKRQKEKKKETIKEKVESKDKKEVFLIYGDFTYLEAKEICKSLNSSLANFEQLQSAFNNGANWCYWGWLEDQSVAYPIQENYWNDIEKIHKGFCGPTPGINRIQNINPLKKFNINCYGIKPKQTKKSIEKEKKFQSQLAKKSSIQDEIRKCKSKKNEEKKKKKIKDMLVLSFNKQKWSQY